MQRGLQHHSRTIRIPVHIGQELTKIRTAERKLTTELGREPTLEELAPAARDGRRTSSRSCAPPSACR